MSTVVNLTEASDDEDDEIEYLGTTPPTMPSTTAPPTMPSTTAPPPLLPAPPRPHRPHRPYRLCRPSSTRSTGAGGATACSELWAPPRTSDAVRQRGARPGCVSLDIACPWDGISPLVCQRSPIACQSCAYHRYRLCGRLRPVPWPAGACTVSTVLRARSRGTATEPASRAMFM